MSSHRAHRAHGPLLMANLLEHGSPYRPRAERQRIPRGWHCLSEETKVADMSLLPSNNRYVCVSVCFHPENKAHFGLPYSHQSRAPDSDTQFVHDLCRVLIINRMDAVEFTVRQVGHYINHSIIYMDEPKSCSRRTSLGNQSCE